MTDRKTGVGRGGSADVPSGAVDAGLDAVDTSARTVDVSTRPVDMAINRVDTSPNTIDIDTEPVDVSIEPRNASFASVDTSMASIDAVSGPVDMSTGRLDTSTRSNAVPANMSAVSGCRRRSPLRERASSRCLLSVLRILQAWRSLRLHCQRGLSLLCLRPVKLAPECRELLRLRAALPVGANGGVDRP